MILGIDEVGRGVWAGPLVVGAVVLGSAHIDGLTDSKALTKKKREQLDAEIREKTAAIGIGWVSAGEIDEIGLSGALRLATKRAVQEVQLQNVEFHEIILDGTVNFLSDTPLATYVTTMKKADLLIPSVSAASIVAKVARDNWMIEQAEIYPEYGFAEHVGYGTERHRSAIDTFGVTPLHRLSIAPLAKYRVAPMKTSRENENLIDAPTTRRIGDESESVAALELERGGHTIIERNWKTKYCEIDIVSRLGDTYYFTEVKHRKNDHGGDGLAAITDKKLNQMRYAAKFYAHTHRLQEHDLRLLAVATTGKKPQFVSLVETE